jgi:hypothetical protein
MFSIRRKAGMMSTPAVIKSIQSITSSGYQNGLIQIRSVNATGAQWKNVPSVLPTETIMEFDESATSISGGTVISTGFCMSYLNATNTDNIDFT